MGDEQVSTTTTELKAWFFRFKRLGEKRKDGTDEYTVSEYTSVHESHDKARARADVMAEHENAGEFLSDCPARIGQVRGEPGKGLEVDSEGRSVRIIGKPRCEVHATYSRDQWEVQQSKQPTPQ